MTQVTLTKPAGGHKAGTTITVSTGAATVLIQSGTAKPKTEPKTKPKPEGGTNTPPRRPAEPLG